MFEVFDTTAALGVWDHAIGNCGGPTVPPLPDARLPRLPRDQFCITADMPVNINLPGWDIECNVKPRLAHFRNASLPAVELFPMRTQRSPPQPAVLLPKPFATTKVQKNTARTA